MKMQDTGWSYMTSTAINWYIFRRQFDNRDQRLDNYTYTLIQQLCVWKRVQENNKSSSQKLMYKDVPTVRSRPNKYRTNQCVEYCVIYLKWWKSIYQSREETKSAVLKAVATRFSPHPEEASSIEFWAHHAPQQTLHAEKHLLSNFMLRFVCRNIGIISSGFVQRSYWLQGFRAATREELFYFPEDQVHRDAHWALWRRTVKTSLTRKRRYFSNTLCY